MTYRLNKIETNINRFFRINILLQVSIIWKQISKNSNDFYILEQNMIKYIFDKLSRVSIFYNKDQKVQNEKLWT